MANLVPSLLFFSAFFFVTCYSTRTIPPLNQKSWSDSTKSRNYTHVCDPKWFASNGLDINEFAYCDSSLSYPVRAKDLVDRMTLKEKVDQLGHRAKGVARLAIPNYNWWSEALHGVSDVGPGTFFDKEVPAATSFPTPILTTAAFDEVLWKKIGEVVSTEARAMYNLGKSGLTFWSPTMNVVRDPRWGRTVETPGEDPFTVGKYSAAYVRGLQDIEGTLNIADGNARPLKVSACCKHYTAYDVDDWLGVDRYHFDAKTREQDIVETFSRPFEMCVKEGDVSSVMCSYNRLNGIPTCADPRLLRDTIRGEWKLNGYIVSDCDSIEVMVNGHHWLGDTKEEAVAHAMKAGLDLDCGQFYTNFTENAVKLGKVRESDIDEALKNLYVLLMRVGYFDGSSFEKLGINDICTNEHKQFALDVARQGIVLLKNKGNTLPMNPAKIKNIAVVGPHANATKAMIGNYAGTPCRYVTPVNGFSTYGNVKYEKGCSDVLCKDDGFIWGAMQAAKNADATVIVVGLDLSIEAESKDRVDLLLPGYQTQLINQVAKTSKGPIVLVIMSAGGVDISFAKNNDKIQAILWAGYPGEQGGQAIADVVFGKANPGGRLPVTWHKNDYIDILPMTSLVLRPDDSKGYPGRTYKFFNGSTVFPFGFGLSYTQFNYKLTSSERSIKAKLGKYTHCHDLRYETDNFKPPCPAILVDDLDCKSNTIKFEVEVNNVGDKDGGESVLVYSKPPAGVADAPIKQLIGFKKVFVKAGKSETVKFEIDACQGFGLVDYNAYKVVPSGQHTIVLGDDKLTFPVQIDFKQ